MSIQVGDLLMQEVLVINGSEINEKSRTALVVEISDVKSKSGNINRFYRLHIGDKLLWYAQSEFNSEKISII